MIRLQEHRLIQGDIIDRHFNSSMIRLQEETALISFAYNIFQFLYDTITSCVLAAKTGNLNDFNSSMIRLQDISGSSTITITQFQFLYDTITSSILYA